MDAVWVYCDVQQTFLAFPTKALLQTCRNLNAESLFVLEKDSWLMTLILSYPKKTDKSVSPFDCDIPISPSLGDLKSICLCVVMEYPTCVFRHIFPTKIYFLHHSCCSTHSDLFLSSYYWKPYKTVRSKMTYCGHRMSWIPTTVWFKSTIV